MKFEVNAMLEYTILEPTTMVLNIHALRTLNQTVINEIFFIEPYTEIKEMVSADDESRFIRM